MALSREDALVGLENIGACSAGPFWIENIARGKSPAELWEECHVGVWMMYLVKTLGLVDTKRLHAMQESWEANAGDRRIEMVQRHYADAVRKHIPWSEVEQALAERARAGKPVTKDAIAEIYSRVKGGGTVVQRRSAPNGRLIEKLSDGTTREATMPPRMAELIGQGKSYEEIVRIMTAEGYR